MSGLEAAMALYREGRLAEAVAECRAALRNRPQDVELLNMLGASLFSSGDAAGAAKALQEAVRIEPGHVTVLTNLGVALRKAGAWAAAERCQRRRAVLEPASQTVCNEMGTVLQELGDLDRSMRVLLRAVRLDPLTGLYWFNLGIVRTVAGDYAGAIEALKRAVVIDPAGGPVSYVKIGEMLLRLGRLEEGIALFQHALRLDSTETGAIKGLARSRRYQAAAANRSPVPDGGFVLRGPFESASGYGHFCQRLVQTLRARAVPLQAIGIMGPESWKPENLEPPVPAKAMVNCLIPLAMERVPGLTSVTFTMFEGTRIPPAWRRQSEHSDLIVVPCESSRAAWAAQGFPEDRLRICPLGVDPESPGDAPALTLVDPHGRLVSSYRHRFLNISDFIPRKNIDGLLRVWLRATAADDDAVLILKLGKSGGAAMSAELSVMLQEAEAAVGRRLAQAAPVVLINQLLSDAEMTGLYRTASHYWSLSHGEGWDLPMSRAGALGLGLIAPRHSAYVDYLDDRVARLIPAAVGPARLYGREEFYHPFHGLDWWIPDEDAAVGIITGIIRGGDRLPSARDHLLNGFTWDRSADRLLTILDEAGLR